MTGTPPRWRPEQNIFDLIEDLIWKYSNTGALFMGMFYGKDFNSEGLSLARQEPKVFLVRLGRFLSRRGNERPASILFEACTKRKIGHSRRLLRSRIMQELHPRDGKVE